MGKFNGFNTGASNMQGLMRQAQRMQQQMLQMQQELEEKEYEATAGGGVVKAVISGKKQLKSTILSVLFFRNIRRTSAPRK